VFFALKDKPVWSGETVKHFRMVVKTLASETVNHSELIGRFADLYLVRQLDLGSML
jgi:hypothetical protein